MSLGNKSKSSSKQVYNTTTKNLNVQGVEGLSLAGIEKSTITITDGGAIEKMADVQKQALVFAENASRNALDFAYQAGRPDAANSKVIVLVMAGLASAALLTVYMVNR